MAGDFWTANADVPPPRSIERLLTCKSLRGVEPLEPGIDAGSERRLPEQLTEVLFGQAGSPPRLAASNTYAVLDEAKITGLPDMLEVADMASRCLFRGSAYHELADVAPWLVQLKSGDGLARKLFTAADPPQGLWNLEAAVFFRSPITFDRLWAHLRRFTRLRDDDGSWFYFRFWEPEVLRCFASGATSVTDFWSNFLPPGDIVTTDPLLNEALIISRRDDNGQGRSPILLTREMKDLLRQQRMRILSRKMVRETAPEGGEHLSKVLHSTYRLVDEGVRIGLRNDGHLRRFVEICRHADGNEPDWRCRPDVVRTFEAGHAPVRLLTELEYDLGAFEQELYDE